MKGDAFERAALEAAKICAAEVRREPCDCPKCRWRRGELGYDPPPREPADPAGASVRLLRGVTDPVEREVILCVMMPGDQTPTCANIAGMMQFQRERQDVEAAINALLAVGFLAEEDGELRPTSLAELAARR